MAARALSRGVGYPGPTCPCCERPVDHASLRSGPQTCPACGGFFEAVRFEPPQRTSRAAALAEAGPGGATSCTSHRGNAAVVNCGRCGVFMCGLCRIDADGLVLCPPCFERLSVEGALQSARLSYRDYGRMAGSLSILGLVLAFVGIVAGPAAVYYGVKGLRQRRAMGEPGPQLGIYGAMALGALEAVGWTVFAFLAMRGGR